MLVDAANPAKAIDTFIHISCGRQGQVICCGSMTLITVQTSLTRMRRTEKSLEGWQPDIPCILRLVYCIATWCVEGYR